jgi:HAD domain in Swiss Army Knife RNA repair proteins
VGYNNLMKVIFLDFDGVLNSATSFLYESNRRNKNKEQGVKGAVNETLSFQQCAALQVVLDHYPELKIVISSTWRELFSLDWLKEKLASYHIDSSRVIDRTPSSRGGDRGLEIQRWLTDHPDVTQYVVIDDNNWGIRAYHNDYFVQTTWEGGFHIGHAYEVIEKLSNDYKRKIDQIKEESGEDDSGSGSKPPLDDNF